MINKKLLTIVLLTVAGVQAAGHPSMLSIGAIMGLTASGPVNLTLAEQDREAHRALLEKIAFADAPKQDARRTKGHTQKHELKVASKVQRHDWKQSGRGTCGASNRALKGTKRTPSTRCKKK